MKHLILISILMFSITDARSQKSMPGFYINLENDTIETQIRIRKGVFGQTTNDFIDEVEVGDSENWTIVHFDWQIWLKI